MCVSVLCVSVCQTDSTDLNSVYLQEVSWTHNLRLCELLKLNDIFHLRINSPTPVFNDTL